MSHRALIALVLLVLVTAVVISIRVPVGLVLGLFAFPVFTAAGLLLLLRYVFERYSPK